MLHIVEKIVKSYLVSIALIIGEGNGYPLHLVFLPEESRGPGGLWFIGSQSQTRLKQLSTHALIIVRIQVVAGHRQSRKWSGLFFAPQVFSCCTSMYILGQDKQACK